MLELLAEIAAKGSVIESVIALVVGLAQRIAEAGVDIAKLRDLSDGLIEHHKALAEAVATDGAPVAVEPATDLAKPSAEPVAG